jgi:CheY-like chemotaxis protein
MATILVIEDDREVREYLVEVLSRAGTPSAPRATVTKAWLCSATTRPRS